MEDWRRKRLESRRLTVKSGRAMKYRVCIGRCPQVRDGEGRSRR